MFQIIEVSTMHLWDATSMIELVHNIKLRILLNLCAKPKMDWALKNKHGGTTIYESYYEVRRKLRICKCPARVRTKKCACLVTHRNRFHRRERAARNHARRWQVCHQKNWKWVYFLNILTFCGFGQTQLSSSGAFSGDVYTSKPKPVISGQIGK